VNSDNTIFEQALLHPLGSCDLPFEKTGRNDISTIVFPAILLELSLCHYTMHRQLARRQH